MQRFVMSVSGGLEGSELAAMPPAYRNLSNPPGRGPPPLPAEVPGAVKGAARAVSRQLHFAFKQADKLERGVVPTAAFFSILDRFSIQPTLGDKAALKDGFEAEGAIRYRHFLKRCLKS